MMFSGGGNLSLVRWHGRKAPAERRLSGNKIQIALTTLVNPSADLCREEHASAHNISRTQTVTAWSYAATGPGVADGGASSPGPILRANEGDLLRLHFSNRTGHDHNLHFHGRHSVHHDGWEPVPPGGTGSWMRGLPSIWSEIRSPCQCTVVA